MTPTEPPKVARWLLDHFGCSPNNATVIGDLAERYRSGRSAAWYWRQTLSTIVVSFVKEVWTHKWPTFTAIVTGWIVFAVSRYGLDLTRELLFALASWSRFWRHDWITIAVQVPEAVLSAVLAGWLVARLHRRNRKAVLLAYATYFAGVQIAWLVYEIRTRTLTEPFRVPLIYDIAFITVVTAGVLLGGGVFGSRRDGDGSKRTSATVC